MKQKFTREERYGKPNTQKLSWVCVYSSVCVCVFGHMRLCMTVIWQWRQMVQLSVGREAAATDGGWRAGVAQPCKVTGLRVNSSRQPSNTCCSRPPHLLGTGTETRGQRWSLEKVPRIKPEQLECDTSSGVKDQMMFEGTGKQERNPSDVRFWTDYATK